MIGWTVTGDTRHIPEEELHAYLDQALSRSQCVEIECHLAECPGCATVRDDVASARDRVTALLAHAEPSRRPVAPPFDTLVANRREPRTRVGARGAWRRVIGLAAIAASLAAAVGAGWWSRERLLGGTAPSVDAEAAPAAGPLRERTLVAVAPPQIDDPAPTDDAEPAPEPPRADPAAEVSVVRVASDAAPLTVQVSTFDPVDDGSAGPLDGLWQAVDWYEAWTLTGGNLPRIEGLPVVGVQIQRGVGEGRPVVVVSQQHPSGRVVRTIEGPVERVATLVESQVGGRVNASAASFTPPDYLTVNGVARRGLRILTVTGALPADSLNALASEIGVQD